MPNPAVSALWRVLQFGVDVGFKIYGVEFMVQSLGVQDVALRCVVP